MITIIRSRSKPAKSPSVPVPDLTAPTANPVQYLLHCLENEIPLEGPVSLNISRIGQEIVDAAVRSASLKMTVKL